jgi:ACT domain-containing protein
MKVELTLGLKDVPGMLVKALDPISGNGGNILGVVHSRGARDVVEVIVTFSVGDQSTLDHIIKALKKQKTSVREIKLEGRKYYKKKSISFLFIGHVIDTDIQDTIDRINEQGLVSDVDVRMSDPEEESSVIMKAEVDESKTKKLMHEVESICKTKKLLLITEL